MNWTTARPTAPGWYWRRFVGNVIPTIIHVRQIGHVLVAEDGPLGRCDFQWGDRPIDEPGEPGN
jgi:hypothetical protein